MVVKPRRTELLRGLIEENKPRIVIGYRKGFWGDYRDLFAGSEFRPEGHFQVEVYQDTLLILTGHLAARSMNVRFDHVASIITDR